MSHLFGGLGSTVAAGETSAFSRNCARLTERSAQEKSVMVYVGEEGEDSQQRAMVACIFLKGRPNRAACMLYNFYAKVNT